MRQHFSSLARTTCTSENLQLPWLLVKTLKFRSGRSKLAQSSRDWRHAVAKESAVPLPDVRFHQVISDEMYDPGKQDRLHTYSIYITVGRRQLTFHSYFVINLPYQLHRTFETSPSVYLCVVFTLHVTKQLTYPTHSRD